MKGLKILALVFTIVYEIFGALILGVLVGIGLDQLFNTQALFTIICSLWGVIHSFKQLLKIGES